MFLVIVVGLIANAGSLVSAQCQPQLSPSRIVVGFGDSFIVNCTSPYDHTVGMGWEAPQNGIEFTQGVSSLPLKIDSVRLWKMNPQCYLVLEDGSQCPITLPVTVYKLPDSVSMASLPDQVVESERFVVQCNVTNVAPSGHLSVIWHKGDEVVHTEHFDAKAKTPVTVSSQTTLVVGKEDDGAQVWCEAKLNFLSAGLHLPATPSKPHTLEVLYSPRFDKPEDEGLEVPANAKIILSCNATGKPAPVYSWTFPQPVQETGMQNNESQVILMQHHQLSGNYSCTASNSVGSKTKYFTVVQAPGNRTTFAAIVGGFLFLGAVLFIAGVFLVKPDGTFSLNKGSYEAAASGPV